MIRHSLIGLALVASVVMSPAASAQAAAPVVADSGIKPTNGIMRVSLYRFADGMQAAAMADLRTHLVPVWEAQKEAGIIVNYSTMNNVTQSSRDDWQFATAITYRNFAALDSLGARSGPISLKHYGSAAARTAAAEARVKLRTLVSSELVSISSYARP